ncbi:MAG: UDP-N-acetylglucosamine 2-epimerase (non-hydrolyzing) [Peptococcaceae bacterium]|jgi:UDP-N-acetylglucosamine 2-epimerase (non-hydrolysing)|nr:UDP-N-acetylglucosamine 2-epimerase (non-hydrolyzing) [Peptococcaceae bacterium]
MKKIMFVFGTRPEAIKMAPLVKAVEAAEDLEPLVVVTAQHREMLDQVLQLFDVHPSYDLNLMKPGQSLTDITAGVLRGIERIVIKEKPDLVLVHGDTTTTFAGALASFYQQVPIGHVEAGLRSGNMYSPFPEEANRRLTGALTSIHLAPTPQARENLLREGINPDIIYTTGNTVIDALMMTIKDDYTFDDDLEKALNVPGRKVLLTTHRRENLGQPMVQIFRAIRKLHERFPDVHFYFPVHLNPKVRALAKEALSDQERVHMFEPLDYAPFANLINRMDLVLTDSGGLQEEAPAIGKPVLVLRDNTERPEAVEAGTVRLVGADTQLIYDTVETLFTDEEEYARMEHAVNPYGDGKACERIVAAIKHYLGLADDRPQDWR